MTKRRLTTQEISALQQLRKALDSFNHDIPHPPEIPYHSLIVNKDSLRSAYFNVSDGKGSHTSGPVDVWHLPEENKYLLVDGHHRLVHHMLAGGGNVPARVVGSGYSDYWATPDKNKRFPFQPESQFRGLEGEEDGVGSYDAISWDADKNARLIKKSG